MKAKSAIPSCTSCEKTDVLKSVKSSIVNPNHSQPVSWKKRRMGETLLLSAFVFQTNAQQPEGYPASYADAPRFKALMYYTTQAGKAHAQFAQQTIGFFKRLSAKAIYPLPRICNPG